MKALLVSFCTHYGFHNQTEGYGALQVAQEHAWTNLEHRIKGIRGEDDHVVPVGKKAPNKGAKAQPRKVSRAEQQQSEKAKNAAEKKDNAFKFVNEAPLGDQHIFETIVRVHM